METNSTRMPPLPEEQKGLELRDQQRGSPQQHPQRGEQYHWRFTEQQDRWELVQESIAPADEDREVQRWAAFCAAMVEWLCWQDSAPFPALTARDAYHLAELWFLSPGGAALCLAAGDHSHTVQDAQHLRR